jgi:hypothetical protein
MFGAETKTGVVEIELRRGALLLDLLLHRDR